MEASNLENIPKISEHRKDICGFYCAFKILNTNLSVQMFYIRMFGYKTV